MLGRTSGWSLICNSDLLVEIPLKCNYHLAIIYKSLLLRILLVAFTIHTSLLLYSCHTFLSIIWIWYNTLHIYQSKSQFIIVGYNISFNQDHKLGSTAGTQILKKNLVRFWYSTTIVNTPHHHTLGRCRSSVHVDHF